jgi:hypothetical protein
MVTADLSMTIPMTLFGLQNSWGAGKRKYRPRRASTIQRLSGPMRAKEGRDAHVLLVDEAWLESVVVKIEVVDKEVLYCDSTASTPLVGHVAALPFGSCGPNVAPMLVGPSTSPRD